MTDLSNDLSKDFDCRLDDFLATNLYAFGFGMNSLEETIFELPHCSSLGPVLLYISISDLFLTLNNVEIVSYADNNTPYCSYSSFEDISFHA